MGKWGKDGVMCASQTHANHRRPHCRRCGTERTGKCRRTFESSWPPGDCRVDDGSRTVSYLPELVEWRWSSR